MAVELVQRVFQAIAERDKPTIDRLLADDLSFSLAGTSRFAGRHIGRETVLELLAELSGTLGISNEVIGMYDGPDSAVVHQTGAAPGYRDESLILFKVSGEQVREIVEFLYDTDGFDAFVAQQDQDAS